MPDRKVRKIEINEIDRFKPRLYADLFIPSWVNGYSIAMEFVHNWFMSRVPDKYFKTVHINGKHGFEDLRKFDYGDLTKRERPAVSFTGTVQADFDNENIDIHMVGIDAYIKRTKYQRSFLKDPKRGRYLGLVPEQILVNFAIRCKTDTRAQQMDLYKRLEIACRIGCTETFIVDLDYHVPYELMSRLAKDTGYLVDSNGVICEPYAFLKYLNSYSQIPFMYKLRYINGKREYFIRMHDIPLYMDMKDKMTIDDGEQDGQTSHSYSIDMNVSVRVPVPKFFIYYIEGRQYNTIAAVEPESTDISIYSMKVFDIPEVNEKGWVQYATSNYLAEKDEPVVKEIDITELFVAPVDSMEGTSLNDLINESLGYCLSPSRFIDVAVYTNDMNIEGKLPIRIDWETRKIYLPENTLNSYFYIAIYIDRLYMNDRIAEKNRIYDHRVVESKKNEIDVFKPSEDATGFRFVPITEKRKNQFPKI